ncbi:unnamed protein product [Cunninghamella echinulata]
MTTNNDSDEYIEESWYRFTAESLEKLSEGDGLSLTDLNESPIFAQLGGQVLSGDIDNPIGTNLIFEIDEKKYERTGLLSMLSTMRSSTAEQDSQNKPRWTAQYKYSADKIIRTTGVDLLPKEVTTESEKEKEHNDTLINLDTDLINLT